MIDLCARFGKWPRDWEDLTREEQVEILVHHEAELLRTKQYQARENKRLKAERDRAAVRNRRAAVRARSRGRKGRR